MEALAAIGLVGNLFQFLEFSSNLISSSTRLYHSTENALAETRDVELATEDLKRLNKKICATATTSGNHDVENICLACGQVAGELITILEKLKVREGKGKRWESVRKGVRSVWSREQIVGLERRLATLRSELLLNVTVDIRDQVLMLVKEQSDRLEHLDGTTRQLVQEFAKQRDMCHTVRGPQRTRPSVTKEVTVNSVHTSYSGKFYGTAVIGQLNIQDGAPQFGGGTFTIHECG